MLGRVTSLARREREALCDTALQLGPDAPTLCEPWDVKQLICHLVMRERSPRSIGISVPPLAPLAAAGMAKLEERDFVELVERFRSPGLVPFGLRGIEPAFNTLEHFVHHEDMRRAQAEWSPRQLSEEDENTIWSFVLLLGRVMARRAGVPVRIEWGERTAGLRGGRPAVVLRGRPSELALVLHGRGRVADVEYDGPATEVARFHEADFSV
jgi:uncharacterized protein (TIGR03085 family)